MAQGQFRQESVSSRDEGPMFVHDAAAELWSDARVKCVLVPRGHQVEVELRNADGSAFLRKTAATRQAALNEAEYLRLLLLSAGRQAPERGLKPFALIIENDPDSHDEVACVLRECGLRALTCRGDAEGLSLARDLAPDLIVVDGSSTESTAAQLVAQLRESFDTAATPIIAVTDAEEGRDTCRADAVLIKPCQEEALLAAVRLFVRHLAPAADHHL
jgi:CheY-like chemotaxis protein